MVEFSQLGLELTGYNKEMAALHSDHYTVQVNLTIYTYGTVVRS